MFQPKASVNLIIEVRQLLFYYFLECHYFSLSVVFLFISQHLNGVLEINKFSCKEGKNSTFTDNYIFYIMCVHKT